MLIRDLGSDDQRKGGGWHELLKPFDPREYKALAGEWPAARQEMLSKS